MSSVLRQTVHDIEILVVDDGSTDDLVDVLQPYISSDPRIRLIRQNNRGLAGARNRGVDEARAEYVACIDADDIWHPQFLDACLSALRDNPDAPFAFAYSFRIDEDDRAFDLSLPKRPPAHDFEGLLCRNSVANGSAMMMRCDIVKALGGFDETMKKHGLHGAEDWKLILQLARTGTPVLVPRMLVGYRLVTSSMSQRDPMRQLRAVRAVLRDVASRYPDTPRRALKDADTMMIAWLLPALLRKRQFGQFLRQAIRAYVLNPAWLLNPLLRDAHARWLKSLFSRVSPRASHQPLDALELENERPFAYFASDAQSPSSLRA